jgi:ribosomal protein S19E (S16A)
MASTAKTVKDVPSHDFVRAYAAHLKRSGKVTFRYLQKRKKGLTRVFENL